MLDSDSLFKLVEEYSKYPQETEWLEFKHNFHSKDELGELISALANGACLHKKPYAFLIFGIHDKSHEIIGTTFKPRLHKVGNEDLTLWLTNRLSPRIDFDVFEYSHNGKPVCLYRIPATGNVPVKFINISFIRINSETRRLVGYPEKEAKIWRRDQINNFEQSIAINNLTSTDVLRLLSTEVFFDLVGIPYPHDVQGVINRLADYKVVVRNEAYLSITNMGALLFAKSLSYFDGLKGKNIRVIVYKGNNKISTIREQAGDKGYAIGLRGLIDWVDSQLPSNELISKVVRDEVKMYPSMALRELIVNSLVHQDFHVNGGPMIEIYSDRIEISNPGRPLIDQNRFIDEHISRNDLTASLMRRMGFCEEKGSGIDKAIFCCELFQLPPLKIKIQNFRTTITMFAHKALNDLDKEEKTMACFQHSCLKYVSNEKMTNQTLRERFKIEDQNSAIASRIIRDALDSKLIKESEPESTSRKFKKYIPYWA